jgi:hypothetical protein
MTEAQKKAQSDAMKARWAERKAQEAAQTPAPEPVPIEVEAKEPEVADEQGLNELRAQMKEVMETNALLRAAVLNSAPNPSFGVGNGGKLLGEVEKYLIDPSLYPNPVPRLAAEPKLQSIAFNFNYELEYEVAVSSYETKTGVNMKEPKFTITLNRIVLDEQGEPTNKRYIARRIVFHEDPQAAMIIAREQGLDIDKTDEKAFLNEMRYIRVKDWLLGIFWPKKEVIAAKVRDEVIGGQLVQVFTKSSVDSTGIDFDQIKSKMV